MERRNFLRGAALAGTGAALATPAVSGGHGTVLTMVQSWPRALLFLMMQHVILLTWFTDVRGLSDN